MTTRRRAIAEEIGSANVVIVADAYRFGWLEAMAAVRAALRATAPELPPTAADALRAWLTEDSPRLLVSWRAEEVVTAVHNAEPKETPT